jgi:hypothetical protein
MFVSLRMLTPIVENDDSDNGKEDAKESGETNLKNSIIHGNPNLHAKKCPGDFSPGFFSAPVMPHFWMVEARCADARVRKSDNEIPAFFNSNCRITIKFYETSPSCRTSIFTQI